MMAINNSGGRLSKVVMVVVGYYKGKARHCEKEKADLVMMITIQLRQMHHKLDKDQTFLRPTTFGFLAPIPTIGKPRLSVRTAVL